MPVHSKYESFPTEAINPATLAIDKLSADDIVEGMLNEDRKVLAAVHHEKERIAVGVDIITQALRRGGRVIFVGAGTSGRLGVLESAEMPPTFGTPPPPTSYSRSWPAARMPSCDRGKGSKTTTRRARGRSIPSARRRRTS